MAEITIDLDTLYGGDSPFPAALVTEAANLALKRWTAPGPGGEQSKVPTELGRRIEEEVQRVITEEARAAAPKVVEEILAEGIQQTTMYGSPKGERKPVRDVIGEQIVAQLTRRDRHTRGERTVLDEMLELEVQKQIRGELQGALDEAKKVIADTVGAEATKALTEALRRSLPGVSV